MRDRIFNRFDFDPLGRDIVFGHHDEGANGSEANLSHEKPAIPVEGVGETAVKRTVEREHDDHDFDPLGGDGYPLYSK